MAADPIVIRTPNSAHLLRRRSDLPPGVYLPANEQFTAGLYLPRPENDRGDAPGSAHLFLVFANHLLIAGYPAEHAIANCIALNQLAYVESGRLLTECWIRIVTRKAEYRLPYSSCDQHAVDDFLRRFRADIMPAASHVGFLGGISCGPPLEAKFAAAETDEIDADEHLLLRFFNPHVRELRRRYWFLTQERWRPADWLGVTRRRIIWLTDRYEGERQVGGIIVRYAAIAHVSDAAVLNTPGFSQLQISFGSTPAWRVPVAGQNIQQAECFAAVLRSIGVCP